MHVTPQDIHRILIYLFILIGSVAFHEFGHAYMADRLGDDTPRRQGRVTLNPIAHIDPIGTLLLPVLGGYFGGGFGWGRPVQWTPSRISRKHNMATARILVAIAGPAMNVFLAVVVALIHTILAWRGVVTAGSGVSVVLHAAVFTNFILFFFNLTPAPPLDGGGVVEGLMPYRYRQQFESYARFGPFIVLAVVMIPAFAQIFLVPANFCTEHLYGLMARLFGM